MRTVLLVAALIPACTIPNPAFNVDASAGGTATSGGGTEAPPTTGSASAASTVDPSVPTTSDTTSAMSTAITVNPTDPTTGTTTDTTADTGGDSSTGEPASCWEQGAANWPIDGDPLNAFKDAKPVDPFLTPDGLRLYYIANTPRRLYLSTRANRGDSFLNGVQQTIWGNDPGIEPGYPTVVLDGAELLFSDKFDVYSAKGTPDQPVDKFALPLPLTPPSSAKDETVITATADSATVIVQRRDGLPIPLNDSGSFRFYQYTRARKEPGSAYAGGTDVTPDMKPIPLTICPALSPDGLHLFFGSTMSATLTEENADDVVGIFYTSRADLAAPWAVPEPISIVHAGKGITCPSSVSADGCLLAFHRFHLQADDYSMYLAARAP